MRKLVLQFLFVLIPIIGLNQKGFLSTKNTIDISVHGNIPLLSGSFNDIYYKPKDGRMIQSKDYINYGVLFSYNRIITKRMGIGLVFFTKDYLINTPSFYTSTYNVNGQYKSIDSIGLKLEALKFRNYSIGPQFEFSTKQGILGIGFSYDLSLGMNISTLINDRYYYSINENNAPAEQADGDSDIDYFDTKYEWKPMYGIFLQTGFKFRVPISRNLSFYTGLRYTGTLMIKGKDFQISDRIELLDNEDYYYKISRKNLFAMSFNIGFTCHF